MELLGKKITKESDTNCQIALKEDYANLCSQYQPNLFIFIFLIFTLFFLATPHGLWDLSSLTRD